MRRVVTQADFDRFAALSHDDNPIHCDPAFARGTHFGATVAHGMFLYGLICGALSQRLGAPWLPAAQTLMFPAPTFAGDDVSVRLRSHDAMRGFDVGIDALRGGTRVETAVGVATVQDVAAAQATAGADPDSGPPPGAPNADSLVDARLAAGIGTGDGTREGARENAPTLHGLAPGQRTKTTRRFEPADLDEYADLCGDANPLVVDASAARRAGLPARIVPGPLLSGLFSDLLGTRLPGRGTGWMKQSLRFLKPAHPGQLLQATVEIVRVRADKQLVNLRSTVRDISGTLLVDGESLVLVRNLERQRG